MTLIFNLIALAIVLAGLAAISFVAARGIERRYPPRGTFVTLDGMRLHVDDRGGLPNESAAVVLIHGASGNMEDMRIALENGLETRFRTILIDRPGRGWSERGPDMASPQRQADAVAQALSRLGVKRAIMVGHSWGGALATAFAIRHPAMAAGLVLLSPTSHPWTGGVSWYYTLATTPVIGPIFAHTLVLPLGVLLATPATAAVFHPQVPPEGYVSRSATWLVLRPSAFIANAQDMVDLKRNLEAMVPLYSQITAPTVILTGGRDLTVSSDVHASALAALIRGARLEILPGVGHVPHHARPDRVIAAVEEVAARVRSSVASTKAD